MKHNRKFYEGCFGIERETLRIDRNGRLAQTPHPFGDDESITRDFCENQIEVITPVCNSVSQAVSELEKLDKKVRKTLAENGEKLWLYSNPPHIDSEDEIPVAAFTGEHTGKRLYREQLERRYGKRLMLYSGVHFNFSFSEAYLREICDEPDHESFRERFYLKLYKQLSRCSWLLLLLTAASPVYELSLEKDGACGTALSRYSSMRSSECGYWNEFVPILSFDSLSDFVQSIKRYVDKGVLWSASELYLPVRLKPRGVNSLDSFENGVSHIELRMFDLDPFEPLGVCEKDLEFAHLLIMFLSREPDLDYTPELQRAAVADHKNAALYDLDGVISEGIPILERAAQVLDRMSSFFEGDTAAEEIIGYERQKLSDRLCTRIRAEDIYKQ